MWASVPAVSLPQHPSPSEPLEGIPAGAHGGSRPAPVIGDNRGPGLPRTRGRTIRTAPAPTLPLDRQGVVVQLIPILYRHRVRRVADASERWTCGAASSPASPTLDPWWRAVIPRWLATGMDRMRPSHGWLASLMLEKVLVQPSEEGAPLRPVAQTEGGPNRRGSRPQVSGRGGQRFAGHEASGWGRRTGKKAAKPASVPFTGWRWGSFC